MTQNDHAAFAADLLALWPALARLDPDPGQARELRQLVLRATRLHDNGWEDLDAAPYLRADGTPHDFRTLPSVLRSELWERATERYAAREPAVSLLIAHHALYLLEMSSETPTAVVQTLKQRIDDALARLGWRREQARSLYQWLRLADAISLQVCALAVSDTTFEPDFLPPASGLEGALRARVSVHDSPQEHRAVSMRLELQPFPLAGVTTRRFACRTTTRSHFKSSSDLALALAERPFQQVPCQIRPLI